ncbi:MAG: UvrB/UvrC motif-containing protein [Christensenellales bacterium]|jgi:protein arginine kinase activator
MFCDECKRQNAAVHFVSIINGEKRERHICQECAKKLGTDSFMTFSWGDVFPTAFAFKNPEASARCMSCGTTLYDITRTGLLGCPACYRNLRSEIMPIIGRVQNRTRHSGRSPMGYEAPKLSKPLEAAPEHPENPLEARLRAALAEAVAAEEYERAAVIRDKLKSLAAGNGQNPCNPAQKEG